MSAARQRRERRLANELKGLATRDPRQFIHIWSHHLNGWCAEIVSRGRDIRRGHSRASFQAVYAIPEKAERLLKAIGEEGERLVGQQTRELLEHECAKVVSGVTDASLYRFETDTVHRLIQSRPQRRRRA